MRQALRTWIDGLHRDVVLTEGCARDLAEMADFLAQHGEHATVDALRTVSRHHRVKAIQLRAQIAALSDRYADLLSSSS